MWVGGPGLSKTRQTSNCHSFLHSLIPSLNLGLGIFILLSLFYRAAKIVHNSNTFWQDIHNMTLTT